MWKRKRTETVHTEKHADTVEGAGEESERQTRKGKSGRGRKDSSIMPQCEVYSVAFRGHNIPSIKRNVLGIEMTQCLGVLAVPPEAPSLAPSTHASNSHRLNCVLGQCSRPS